MTHLSAHSSMPPRLRRPRESTAVGGARSGASDISRGRLVLLIDDVEDNRDMYAQFFVHVNWRVLSAADGEAGLRHAVVEKPDAIVLDLSMPGLDGYEVARRLKAHPATKAIPLIALTGNALDQSRREAEAAGFDGYVMKPCLPDELAAVIRRHLR